MTHKFYLSRLFRNEHETIGIFSIAGRVICHSLEDEKRTVKMFGETRIPSGVYEIKFRTAGRLHVKYKEMFPNMHKGMLWIQDIENFTFCYIHIGNNDTHTAGCPLTGVRDVIRRNNRYVLEKSTTGYTRLYPLMADCLVKNETVLLDIRDEPTADIYDWKP